MLENVIGMVGTNKYMKNHTQVCYPFTVSCTVHKTSRTINRFYFLFLFFKETSHLQTYRMFSCFIRPHLINKLRTPFTIGMYLQHCPLDFKSDLILFPFRCFHVLLTHRAPSMRDLVNKVASNGASASTVRSCDKGPPHQIRTQIGKDDLFLLKSRQRSSIKT